MKLSSAYLYEQLNQEYEILGHGGLSGKDGYLRPFLCCGNLPGKNCTLSGRTGKVRDDRQGRVCVVPVEKEESFRDKLKEYPSDGTFLVFCEASAAGAERHVNEDNAAEDREMRMSDGKTGSSYVRIAVCKTEDIAGVLNHLQRIFDLCDDWDRKVNDLLTDQTGLGKILEVTSEFLGNPLMVMGLDFSLIAETGTALLPPRARLFSDDGVNMDYMNALLQDEGYQKLAQTKETVLFPAYISGCRSLNRNLYLEGQPTHRMVLTECQNSITEGNICILEALTGRLEYLLSHETEASMTGDLEQIFERILSDRTADYMQASRQLSALGWSSSHEYLCLILQITYLNQKQLSTKAICRYIKKQFRDSISFLYQEELVTFFNLTRLGVNEDEAAAKLVYFIRDSYLKAGYSRTMKGHMNLRRQYVQARTALDVGSRKKPYLWIHHFSQVALTYIMEQVTRRLPGNMLCHEGLLRLKELDEKNHTEYVQTLKAYLEQHLSATQAAKELFIHRSTFLYRLERIKEILQSELDDPEELFYLELSLRLLEQEEEKS